MRDVCTVQRSIDDDIKKRVLQGNKMKATYTYSIGVPTADCYSTSRVRTLFISLSNIVCVISSTWTVIRLSAATLLYALPK